MTEFERYGELSKSEFDAVVRAHGRSTVVTITPATKAMGLEIGDAVHIVVTRPKTMEE